MDEVLSLNINYQGKSYAFEMQERNYGYVQKVVVVIGNTEVTFEPDEEGSYRALVSPELVNQQDNLLSVGLLQAITLRLELLRRN
jgi:hypothetical protein